MYFSRIDMPGGPWPRLCISSLIDQTLRSDSDQPVLTSQPWPAEVAMVEEVRGETMSGQFSTSITWSKYRPGSSQGLPPTSRIIPPRQANISSPLHWDWRGLMTIFSGLSRSTSFATESLLGGDEIDAGKTEGSRVMKGTSEFTMGR